MKIVNSLFFLTLVAIFAIGCRSQTSLKTVLSNNEPAAIPIVGSSYLELSQPSLPSDDDLVEPNISPEVVIDYNNVQYSPISLEQCVVQALQNSEVFRDLSGTVVSTPDSLSTTFDPAITYTDPTFGEEAALSAFDANLVTSAIYENNDRAFNNLFTGDSNGLFQQSTFQLSNEINKLNANGTLLTARSSLNFDNNNQAGQRFDETGGFYEAILEAGFRHPLLQGSGTLFNRIAGPSQTPGTYNGVLIARTNTEITLSEFRQRVREFVSDVENAYWDLYYAYRELDAQIDARDAAHIVYTNIKGQEERRRGLLLVGAKEQYLRFESAINDSLEGRPIESTQSNSGLTGGTFRRNVGVRIAERRLRYLIGMQITDGSLLQPADKPVHAPIQFNWEESLANAFSRRPEVTRQKWVVKQRDLELVAARNFLLPRVDLIGNYRVRGLGDHLARGNGATLGQDIANDTDDSSALATLRSGDFQEFQLGAELRLPIGYRQANAAVRNAELEANRARALLKEQKRRLTLELSNAFSEVRRSFSAMKLAEERFDAALQYRTLAADAIENSRATIDVLLEAQRRVLESQLQFVNAEVEYVIALKNVQFENGTFLNLSLIHI